MSDRINHECGIAMVRLLKPLEYYLAKYGTVMYGMNKLHLLMQKQHNRGQDGAGIATIKFDLEPGINTSPDSVQNRIQRSKIYSHLFTIRSPRLSRNIHSGSAMLTGLNTT